MSTPRRLLGGGIIALLLLGQFAVPSVRGDWSNTEVAAIPAVDEAECGETVTITFRLDANPDGDTYKDWRVKLTYNTSVLSYDSFSVNSAVWASGTGAGGQQTGGDGDGWVRIGEGNFTGVSVDYPVDLGTVTFEVIGEGSSDFDIITSDPFADTGFTDPSGYPAHAPGSTSITQIDLLCNEAPEADADGPYSGYHTDTVTLDGSGSTDSDGIIATYAWQVGGEEVYSGSNATHNLPLTGYSPGTYAVVLTVTDDDGDSDQASTTLDVLNVGPTADAGGPYTGDRTETMTLDGSGSDDPDGTIATYAWEVEGVQVYSGSSDTYGLPLSGYDLGDHEVALTVTDDQGATHQDTTTLTVENAAPVANDDTAVTNQNTPVDIAVTANDEDPDRSIDPTTVSIVQGPDHGSVSVGSDGVVTYSPDAGYTGSDSFTYTVDDNDGATSNVATVSITVNAPPTAEAGGPYAGTRADTVTLNGDGSDDPDGTIATYAWAVDGVLVYSGSSDTYSLPLSGYTLGDHEVVLTVTDDQGATDQDTATLTVSNASPLADAGGPYEGDRTETVTLDGTDSSDPDGSIVTYQWLVDGTEVSSGASATYELALGGYDVGTYDVALVVTDDDGATDEDTTTLTVSNASPLANAAGPYEGDRTETVTLDGTDSSDPDGSIVTYQWLVDGTEVSSGASATYDLALGDYDVGTYDVALIVTDDDGATDEDTTTLTVNNLPPTADANGPYGVGRDQDVTLDGSGSSDPDGTIVAYRWLVDGTEVYSGTSPTYDLSASDYALGAHTVVLVVTDDDGATDEDTTTLVVTNVPPVAVDDSAATDEETAVAIEVLANDNDPDGELDPGTVTIVTSPANGSVSVGANGVVTYTPDADFFGSDSFTYTVDDEDGATSNEATVSIDVNAQPVAVDDEVGTMQDMAVDVEVLANDYDPDGRLDRTSVAIVDEPESGSVSVRADGLVTYTPEDGFVGEDTFTYTVDDDDGITSNVATVTVNVAAAAPDEWFIYLPVVCGGG